MTDGSAGLLIGTHTYPADGEAGRRQDAAVASLLALSRVSLVNVQLARAPHDMPGLPTLAVLRRTSNTVSGAAGREKGTVRETFDALCAEASSRGLPYFCFTNGDILFSQQAVDWVLDSRREVYVFSREDFDGASGTPLGIEVHGVDAMAVATGWWRRNSSRFRDYIIGESTWDNVYASILLCHADGAIENRRGLIRHERHERRWTGSPFAEYTRLLAARDAGYFTIWCRYLDALERMRETGCGPAEEDALARSVFTRTPSVLDRAVQGARRVKARVRYEWLSRRA